MFGIFNLLGYQFSPRLADISGARFWRVDPKADYGALGDLAAHRVNTQLIEAHWEDLLRLAGSLKLSTVQATGLIRTLQTKDRSTKLDRALEEWGRLAKSLYMLSYIDDEACPWRAESAARPALGERRTGRVGPYLGFPFRCASDPTAQAAFNRQGNKGWRSGSSCGREYDRRKFMLLIV